MTLVGEVFADRQFLVEARRLENHAEMAADCVRLAEEIEAEKIGAAIGRPNERRKDAEESGLSAAVRAEQAENFAGIDRERDLIERPPLAVAVGQAINCERRRSSGGSMHERENDSWNAAERTSS